jgi:hypothetical protein
VLPRLVPLTDRYAQRPTVRALALRDGRRRPSWSESTQRPPDGCVDTNRSKVAARRE